MNTIIYKKRIILLKKSLTSKTPSESTENGESQPPKNKIEVRADIKIIFAYSAIKNTAKPIPEYSHGIPQLALIHLQQHQKVLYWFQQLQQ